MSQPIVRNQNVSIRTIDETTRKRMDAFVEAVVALATEYDFDEATVAGHVEMAMEDIAAEMGDFDE